MENETTPDNVVSATSAIDYIKGSGFYSDPKYFWIAPLINKVLANEPTDADIKALLGKVGSPENPMQTVTRVVSVPLTHVIEPHNIRTINEITTVSNVGLVNVTQPLKLEAGLNIFYGKNGAGKSSIYNALCSIFGKDKKVHPNLEVQGAETFCAIKYTNQTGTEAELRWDMGTNNPHSPTMIFDGQIAQTLVDNDQDNKFEIAHLKLEYFSYLHNLYDKVDDVIKTKIINLRAHTQTIEESNRDALVFIFNCTLDELTNITRESLSDVELARLTEIEVTLKILGRDNPEAVVKNLSTIKGEIFNILTTFGSKEPVSGEWQVRHTREKLDKLNERIRVFSETKAALDAGGITKLATIVPSDWIQNPLWGAFIAKSIEFTESLNESLKHKYEDDICVYCQQELTTPESKKLIEAYREITAEHKSKLEEEKNSLQGTADTIENTYITKLASITDINTLITPELDATQSTTLSTIDSTALTAIYTSIKNSVSSFKAITVSDEELAALNKFYEIYVALEKAFASKITDLNTAITSRESTLKVLNDKVSPLRRKSVIQQNLITIQTYLDLKTKLKELEEKSAGISSLKKATSTQETSFANIASLEEFKTCLKQEYNHFNFTPPSFWNLKSVTPGGVNKRCYSLGDKRLADIFSEGERKLHALADFFAQCEVNKYNGVYIFDDPVNSLDEDNIVKVAKRIVKLAESGNQIIVFTHNLYFLNALDKDVKKNVYKVSKIKPTNGVLVEGTKLDTDNLLKTKLNAINEQIKLLEAVTTPGVIQIGAVYDLISSYIEEYVEKKLLCNVVSRYRANIRMSGLSALSTITEEKILLITELYENASRGGNRHDNPEDAAEPTFDQLKTDVQTLITNLDYK